MQDFESDILEVNKKGRLFFFAMMLALTLLVIALMFLGFAPVILSLCGMVIFAFTAARYYLQTRRQVLKKPVGKLRITADSITAFGRVYKISELNAILVSFSGWRSYKRSTDRSVPLTDMHTGDSNFLQFVYKGSENKFEFLLETQEHWQQLRSHVISWYRRNIKVIENAGGGRSYGLEILNYSQIQEFKKMIANPDMEK